MSRFMSRLGNRYWRMAIGILTLAFVLLISYQFWWGYTRLPYVDRAPNFTMSNLDNKLVKLGDTDGKVRLISFFYSRCPDVCQVTNANLAQIQEKLRQDQLLNKEALILSITFDPKNDTPQMLKKYVRERNIQFDGWEFLRGTPEQTKAVLAGFKVIEEDRPGGLLGHSNELFLVDKNENIRAVYKMGSLMDSDKIVKDIKNLVSSDS